MKKTAENKKVQGVKNPLKLGQKTIDDIFEANKDYLNGLNFISEATVNCDYEKYNLPSQNNFLHKQWNKTFSVMRMKNKLKVRLIANFVVIDVKECILNYNDKSNKKPLKSYIATLQNTNGKIEKDVEITNNSKSDFKQFQSDMNSYYNDFIVNMKEAEFKTFVVEYISPKVASIVNVYTNAGKIDDNKALYENALVTAESIIWANEDGYIKTGENSYIKLKEATHYLPKLFKTNKTGKQVANELMENIIECWSENVVLPLITLGHMVMAFYYEDFIKHYGCPTLILYGETGTGKSTLVTVGLAIFGLAKDALVSGGSTAKSNEYFCSRYNSLNVCTDDIKGDTLNSSNFAALVKGAYQGMPRTRMLPYGRGVEYISICSPLAYSTNETLPDLREVINRMNVIEIFGKVFKAGSFKYHELNKENPDNLKELSLILPEFIKIPKDEVLELYENVFEILKANVPDTQQRVINNIAYAYTGAILLLSIANIQVENFEEKVIEYAKKQIEKYENVKTPVDKVLAEIPTLYELGVIEKGKHFKIAKVSIEGKETLQVRFKKDVLIGAINKYYSNDKRKRIDEGAFLSYAKNHKRYRDNITSRFDGKSVNAICFDVTNLKEYADFGSIIESMSYAELKECVSNKT